MIHLRRVLCLLATSAAALVGRPAAAQVGGAGDEIRVVETFDPAAGIRYRQVVHDLTPLEIRAVQRALRAAGFGPRRVTAELDRATREALGAFQRQRGLSACACPSYETIVALGLRPSVVLTVVVEGERSAAGRETLYTASDAVVYYPVPIPVLVPGEPDEGDGGGDDGDDGDDALMPLPPGSNLPVVIPESANRPGIRPAPPPRVSPTQTRVIHVPSGAAPHPRIVH